MAEGEWSHHCLPESTITSEHGTDVAFADDVNMLDATNQAFGYAADAESYIPFSHITPLPPAAAARFGALHEGDVINLDVPAVQGTSQMDPPPPATTLPHCPPPEMTYSALNDTPLQRAPGLHISSNTCKTTVGQDDVKGNADPQQTQYATAEDWNRHRETFTKLYLEENKTLNEVMSIMKEQYGFKAT